MQLYPILVVAIVLAADSGMVLAPDKPLFGSWGATAMAVVPVLVIVLLAGVALRRFEQQLSRGEGPQPIRAADRLLYFARWLILANHAVAVLMAGWLQAVRSLTGNLVLVDEFIVMLPPLLGPMLLWWLHYPIERRLREALLLRRLDQGKTIYQIPGRGRYVLQQSRLHLLLLLVPVLFILALVELIRLLLGALDGGELPAWFYDAATFAAGLLVFLFSPFLARLVLSVEPLAPGEVRDDLQEICRRHRVRIREILLWKTDGAMINAAVMGLVGPLRFVLLTDAILETMSREQVRAVMAHEIGHIRRHHMPWLVASLLAMLLLAGLLVSVPFMLGDWMGLVDGTDLAGEGGLWINGAATLAAGGLALLAFGWISRRYERQADTFAVQHLSGLGEANEDGSDRVTPESVAAMQSALETIARLNAVDPHRKSWRHGSIAWRQNYLASIVGHARDALPIDRFIRWSKLAVALVLLLAGTATFLLDGANPSRVADPVARPAQPQEEPMSARPDDPRRIRS